MSKHDVSLDLEQSPLVSSALPLQAAMPAPRRSRLRRLLLTGAGLAVVAGAAYLGEQYWTVGRYQVSTDDAYVQADNTTVAPKVSGYLSAVLVRDNEQVEAGQVLARVDDRDFQTALAQATANVDGARARIDGKQAALDIQQSIILAAQATLAVDRANQAYAEQDVRRYASLASTGAGSVQNAQQASARISVASATLARDMASLMTAVKTVEQLRADLAAAQASLATEQALQRQAELNLSYTAIAASVDGVVGNRTLRIGQYVQAGTQLMAVVPMAEAYVVANFKETQLTNVHPGQPVVVKVDMFPDLVIHAHVDSLAPASGQQFALLPPDNATGNFTKVVQRIPVRISIDKDSAALAQLRPGMSVTPTIDTQGAETAPPRAQPPSGNGR